MAAHEVVHDWLDLSPDQVDSYATSPVHKQELATAVYSVLESHDQKYQKILDGVCKKLFAFYRSRDAELQMFTLQFLPTLIYIYLNSVASGKKKNCWSVETLLIGLYNLEVVDEAGQPRVISFRLPSLAQASLYHEPLQLNPGSLTQKELRRLEECNTRLITWGPLPQIETLNAQNRLKVMTALWFIFNRQLSHLHKSALEKLCQVCSKLVGQGFSRTGGSGATNKLPPRIPVSTQFLLELLHAVYFAMFNEFSSMAVQALEDIQFRGCYECYAEVILVAGAVRNSIRDTPTVPTPETLENDQKEMPGRPEEESIKKTPSEVLSSIAYIRSECLESVKRVKRSEVDRRQDKVAKEIVESVIEEIVERVYKKIEERKSKITSGRIKNIGKGTGRALNKDRRKFLFRRRGLPYYYTFDCIFDERFDFL